VHVPLPQVPVLLFMWVRSTQASRNGVQAVPLHKSQTPVLHMPVSPHVLGSEARHVLPQHTVPTQMTTSALDIRGAGRSL